MKFTIKVIIKFIIGFFGGLIMFFILKLLSNYIFKFTIDDFYTGFICSVAVRLAIDIYDIYKKY